MAIKDPALLTDALELAELLRTGWAQIDAGLRASGVPLNEGEPDPEPDPAPDPEPDPDPDPDPDAGGDDLETWKRNSRKHERDAKKTRTEAEKLRKQLAEREDADKSEQQKAIDQAREEARTEAVTEAEQERRADRLEVAVTRLAAKGVKVGEGDDATTVKFADTEDALINLERAIKRGDVDADDIYDSEGKVQTDALTTALQDLLEAKPHLAADAAGTARTGGDADAGKGSGAKSDLRGLSPDDHLKRIQNRK